MKFAFWSPALVLSMLACSPGEALPGGSLPEGADPEEASRAIQAELALTAESVELAAGAPFVLTAQLRNLGRREFTMMLPIDGCDVGWRRVSYRWQVTRADGGPVATPEGGRCGNTNPIQTQDFATLAAGESTPVLIQPQPSFLSGPELHFDLAPPGTYRLQLTYSFHPGSELEAGLLLGPVDEDVLALLGRTAALTLVSNTVEVRRLD